LRRVLEATRLVDGRYELGVLLRHVITEACSMTGARYGALAVLDEDGSGIAEFVTVGLTPEEESRIGPRPQGKGLLGLLITESRTLSVDRLCQHPASSGFPKGHPPMTSLLGVPLKVGDEVYGNLYLADKQGGLPFGPEDRDMVEALALAAGIGIENTRLHAALRLVTELQYDIRRDHLTGLDNRRSWDERLDDELKRSQRSGAPLSVALLDLDGFKAINDRRGHLAGDQLLREFSDSWRRIVRLGGDFVARLGGDEFGLLAPGTHVGGVRRMAVRHARLEPDGIPYSIGVATWDGTESAGQLMHRADMSMYQCKAGRRDS
jgi:diguanylate cyclase (GGDEF)-like protein